MSLLWMEYETEFEHLVEASYERESNAKSEYFNSLNNRVKKDYLQGYCIFRSNGELIPLESVKPFPDVR